MASATGYGPSTRPAKNLTFEGDDERYELWEERFRAHLRLHKLHKVAEEEPAAADDAAVNERNIELNAQVFAELVQFLDDKSLSLIIRDAKNDGRKALRILREHYLGSSKPRIIALYTELTSLKMNSGDSVTNYILKAEKAATCLKNAGETISDSLLMAMVLKGLPDSFKAFSTVITQKDSDEMNFLKFKSALRSYEESEKARVSHCESDDNIMKVNGDITCYQCGKFGHKKHQCKSKNINAAAGATAKPKRWCSNCKSSTHDTNYCRKKNSAKFVSNSDQQQDNY
jgi:hypothetical protein